jgi:hypothetical protein
VPVLHWDASALLKRYHRERATDCVDALFDISPPCQNIATFWSYAETVATLLRKQNDGRISLPSFHAALVLLEAEVLGNPDWQLLDVERSAILDGVQLLQRHNLNSTDAAILVTYLDYIRLQPPGSSTPVLVAADARLLRAATAEGLATLNPETLPAADVPTFLASL